MRSEIVAAVLRQYQSALQLETIHLDACRPDEVLVQIEAAGVCHTDIVVRDGFFPIPPMPVILGHEGAGIVSRVGSAVTKVQPGDRVVLSFASCGHCTPCDSGAPSRCVDFVMQNLGGRREDGSTTHQDAHGPIFGNFFGQSSFATQALVRERNLVKVDADVPLEVLAPLGCGIQTGAGTVLNFFRPEPGSSLAVFGGGAVGLSAVMAGKVSGCHPIILVDIIPTRLELGQDLGATHVIDAASEDVAAKMRKITGSGATWILETSGAGAAVVAAIQSLAPNGTLAPIAVYPPDGTVTVPINSLKNGRIESVIEGQSDPQLFIPRLIELYQRGQFPFDRLITLYEFEKINEALDDSEKGRVIKPVLLMPGASARVRVT